MSNNYSPVTTKPGTEIVHLLFFNLQIVKEQLGKMYNFPSPDGHNKKDNCNTL